MTNKTTLVIGASTNEERYSNKAIIKLLQKGHTVNAIGVKEGIVENVIINKELIEFENIDTVTLYINPTRQEQYYDYILSLKPQRIIFNPGTENNDLSDLATKHGITCMEACTLVLLQTNQY
jgi:uncharacterized protein